ncbi:adipolin-like isoform X1 [Clytia hemisphaerica]
MTKFGLILIVFFCKFFHIFGQKEFRLSKDDDLVPGFDDSSVGRDLIRKAWIHILRQSKEKMDQDVSLIEPSTEKSLHLSSTINPIKSMSRQKILLAALLRQEQSKPILDDNTRRQRAAFLAPIVPQALSGFTVTLKKSILIPKKRFTFLSEFTASSPESFVRGTGLDMRLGRFTVPYTAMYNFNANLNIHRPLKMKKGGVGGQLSDGVTARLCIDGECFSNIMKFRLSTSSNAKSLTINFSGTLKLKKDEYIEIVVENALSTRIIITEALFSGYLVGS